MTTSLKHTLKGEKHSRYCKPSPKTTGTLSQC